MQEPPPAVPDRLEDESLESLENYMEQVLFYNKEGETMLARRQEERKAQDEAIHYRRKQEDELLQESRQQKYEDVRRKRKDSDTKVLNLLLKNDLSEEVNILSLHPSKSPLNSANRSCATLSNASIAPSSS